MSNVISLSGVTTTTFTMSNQGTDLFLELLILASESQGMTASQKEIISFLKQQREINNIAPGTVDFEIGEMPWNEDYIIDDIEFLMDLSQKAKDRSLWDKLGFEPDEKIVDHYLDTFRNLLKEFREMNRNINEERKKKTLVSEKWERFMKCSDQEKEKLLDHTFSFCIDDVGSGWEYIHFDLDGENIASCRVSYIGPDLHAFFNSISDLKEDDFEELVFLDEPGEYRFLFSRRNEYIYIEMPDMEEGFFLKYDYFMDRVSEEFYKWFRY